MKTYLRAIYSESVRMEIGQGGCTVKRCKLVALTRPSVCERRSELSAANAPTAVLREDRTGSTRMSGLSEDLTGPHRGSVRNHSLSRPGRILSDLYSVSEPLVVPNVLRENS